MTTNDLAIKESPVAEFTDAEAARKAEKEPEPEKDKPVPMLTKLVGLGAIVAAAIFLRKKLKGKFPESGDDHIVSP